MNFWRTARDWAEFGRESVTWGSMLRSQQQTVPEGPVRDALGAVDLGAKLDAKTADWPKLREELEALLKKPDEDNQPQQDKQSGGAVAHNRAIHSARGDCRAARSFPSTPSPLPPSFSPPSTLTLSANRGIVRA